ncbi:ankyrin repeat-containing domain protein [Trichoderma pleuroticola]
MSPFGPLFVWVVKNLLLNSLRYAPKGLVPKRLSESTTLKLKRVLTNRDPIRTLHDPPDANVDIIAVHGLGSSVETTWTHKESNKLWLRDFLPLDLPKARIMTYSHNSTWQSQALVKDLSDYGRQFLDVLERMKDETLVLAKEPSNNENTQRLRDRLTNSLAGAIFLGTPHAGSGYSLLGKLYCLFHYWEGANPLLLGYMDPGSKEIRNLEDKFIKHYPSLSFDFHETMPNVILGMEFQMVVTRDSSTRLGQEKVSLDTNHFDLNKYYSKTDASYVAVKGKMTQMLQSWNVKMEKKKIAYDASEKELLKSEVELLKSLKPCLFNDEEKRQRNLTPGTCEWITQENEFQNWTAAGNGPDDRVLWVLGNPGSGKTFIAQWLCDHLRQTAENNVMCFFFDAKNKDSKELRSLKKFYQTILHQLLQGIKLSRPEVKADCFATAEKIILREGMRKTAYIEALRQVLSQAGRSFLVIDAVDECADEEIDAVQEWLNEIRRFPNLHIVITSRPRQDAENLYDNSPCILLNDVVTQLNKDIEKFILSRINKPGALFPERMPKVVEKLKARSSGMILYARLTLDILENIAGTEDQLLTEMDNVPENLTELYTDRIEKIKDTKFARKILQWLVTCRRPLTVDSLRGVDIIDRSVGPDERFDLDENIRGGLGEDVDGRDRFRMFLRRHLLPLVEILQDDTVRLVHTTVAQFLLGEKVEEKGKSCPENLRIDLDVSHEDIAMCCVTYLRWNYGSARSAHEASSLAFLDNKDLLDYAVLEWPYHCEKSEVRIMARVKEKKAVMAFFRETHAFAAWVTARADRDGLFRAHFGLYGDAMLPWPQHIAVFFNIQRFGELLLQGNDINLPDATGSTVLHIAAGQGYTLTVKALLEQGARMDMEDSTGAYPLHRAVRRGNHETLKQLLVRDTKQIVNLPDKYKFTPMHVACQLGWTQCVAILLEHDASLSNDSGAIETPIGLAIENGHIDVVRTLLKHTPSLVGNCRKPLIQAARRGSIDMVKFLCESGVDTSYKDQLGQTALHKASIFGQADLVEYLLETNRVPVDAMDESQRTPLYFAAERGHVDVVDCLLRYHANKNSLDRRRETALFKPAGNGHLKMVERLLKAGTDATILDHWKRTPLRFAAMKGHIEVVRMLLEETQIQQDIPDWTGRTVLHNAAAFLREGQEDVIDILFEHGASQESCDDTGGTALHAAILRHQGHPPPTIALLERLVQGGVSLEAQDHHGRTALFLAAAVQNLAAVKFLLSAGAEPKSQSLHAAVHSGNIALVKPFLEQRRFELDLNERDEHGNTTLHVAASRGYDNIVTALLRAGARTRCLNMDQQTPWDAATRAGQPETARLLLNADPNPEGDDFETLIESLDDSQMNVQDILGRTPLHTAVILGHKEAVSQLLEAQVSPDIQDQIGRTPLHYAARRVNPAIAKALVTAKANVNIADAEQRVPLYLAAEAGNVEGVKMLLAANAEFTANHQRRTPLHAAALKGSVQTVRALLVGYGGGKETRLISMLDNDLKTAIHLAAEQGYSDVVEELLKHSQGRHAIVIDKQDGRGRTALFMASRNGHLNVVQQLIRAGSIIYRIDKDRKMAIHLAAKGGHLDIVRLLLDELPSQVEVALKKWEENLPDWPHNKIYQGDALIAALAKAGGLVLVSTSTGLSYSVRASKWTIPEERQKLQADVVSGLRTFDEERHSVSSTTLMQAVLGGHTDVVKLLLDKVPEMPLQAEHYGYSNALSLAASRGHVNIAKLLIEAGSRVNAFTDSQETCLHKAAENGYHEIIQILLENDASPDLACLRDGSTPLHLAAKGGHEAAVRELVRVAFVNATDDLGCTALHVACLEGHNAVVNVLVDADADLMARDFERRTPLELVERLNEKTRAHMREQAGKQRERREVGH